MKHHEDEAPLPLPRRPPDPPPSPAAPPKPAPGRQPARRGSHDRAWPFPTQRPPEDAKADATGADADGGADADDAASTAGAGRANGKAAPGVARRMHRVPATLAAAALATLAALAGDAALAQSPPATIGEVLDRGGRQLSGDETKALAAGATIAGSTGQGFELRLDGEGRLLGWVGASRIPASGRWNVNDQGQLCWDIAPRVGGMRYGTCVFWYQLDGQHFASETGARESAAQPRQVKR